MLHAIACFFNPAGYRRIRENLHRFRDNFRGCPLTVVELSFDGRFELADSLHITGDSARHALWQKERLLNLAERTVPPEVDKVAWVDADLLFLNPDWAEQAEAALENSLVCQLFSRAHHLDARGTIERTTPGIAAAGLGPDSWPGFAWAARRKVFPLYDKHVVGGGDFPLYCAFRGDHLKFDRWHLRSMNVDWQRAYVRDAHRIHRTVQGRIAHVPGDVVHLHHGTFANRRYAERLAYLSDHAFDPSRDLKIRASGLWEWSSDKPLMHALVGNYFSERNEDNA